MSIPNKINFIMSIGPEQIFIVNADDLDQHTSGAPLHRAFAMPVVEAAMQPQEAQTSLCLPQSMNTTASTHMCRLCATVTELVVPIFEGEGLQNNLADKIHQHLPIQVSQNDVLPTVLCFQCTSTLLAWHELVVCCVEADTVMRDRCNLSTQHQQQKQPNAQSSQNHIKDEKSQLPKVIKNILTEYIHTLNLDPHVELVCQKCTSKTALMAEDFPDHLITTHHTEVLNENAVHSFIKDHVTFEEPLVSDLESNGDDSDTTESISTINKQQSSALLCPYCDSAFSSSSRLIYHLGKHMEICIDDGVTCCDNIYNTKKDFVSHLQEKHVNRLIYDMDTMCKSCNFTADSAEELKTHVEECHCENKVKKLKKKSAKNQKWIPAVCPECNKTFSNKYNMFTHMKSHDTSPTFACHRCDKRYSTKGNLQQHVKLIHEGVLLHVCGACGERFPTRAARDVHARLHTGDKPFRCELCGAAFRAENTLLRHLDMHLDVRKHECSVREPRACVRCEHCAQFYPDTHLRAHIIAAHAPLLYLCTECDLYRNRADMMAHMATHIGNAKEKKLEEFIPPNAKQTPKIVIPVVRIQRFLPKLAPTPLAEPSSMTSLGAIPSAIDSSSPIPISDIETVETDPSPTIKAKSKASETNTVLNSSTESSDIGKEGIEVANENPQVATVQKQSTSEGMVSSVQNNEFSDHSDSDNEFGRLPESVFDAIEDSQDTRSHDDQDFPDTEKNTTKKPNLPRPCPVCEKQCNSLSGWYYHLKRAHGTSRSVACDECNKVFASGGDLATHARVHTKEKPFVCRVCSREFSSRAGRYVHEETHSGTRTHACSRCPRAFRWRAQLNRHEARHKSARSHVCAECGRGFNVAFDLLRHVRSHNPECHRCDVCNATFKQKRYLKVHMENIHLTQTDAKTCKRAKSMVSALQVGLPVPSLSLNTNDGSSNLC